MSEFKECVYRINFNTEEERVANIRSLMAKLDAEGWDSDAKWNEAKIKHPHYVFLRCHKDGEYIINTHDCDFEKNSFPLLQWPPEQPDYAGWTHVDQDLPEPNKTIWMTDGKDWVALGCLAEYSEGGTIQRCWAQSNGTIYVEEGEIVTECEMEDLNVVFWMYAPKMPKLKKHVRRSF